MKNIESGENHTEEKAPGDEVEEEILGFFGEVFGSVKYVQQTKKWGENDRLGIDGVIALENDDGQEFLLALETSGPDEERRKEKTRQQKREPMVYVLEEKDENGNIIIGAIKNKIPRLRIGYNLNYILTLVHEAKDKGMKMSHNMQQNHRKELMQIKKNILDSFEKQIEAQTDYEFRQAIKPIELIFESEKEEMD